MQSIWQNLIRPDNNGIFYFIQKWTVEVDFSAHHQYEPIIQLIGRSWICFRHCQHRKINFIWNPLWDEMWCYDMTCEHSRKHDQYSINNRFGLRMTYDYQYSFVHSMIFFMWHGLITMAFKWLMREILLRHLLYLKKNAKNNFRRFITRIKFQAP